MRLSITTSLFTNYLLSDAVELIGKAGFQGIDIWCGRPHMYRKDHSPADLQRLKQSLSEKNLELVSLMPAFYRYPYSLSSPLETVRQDSVAYVKDCIDNASILGAKHVLIVPTHTLVGQPLEDARALFIQSLAQVCEYAEGHKMALGMEVVYPNSSDYLGYTQEAIRMIQAVQSPCLGVVIDTGHLNLSGEDFVMALDQLGDLTLQVHISDNDARIQQNAIPGEGNFDFSRFLSALQNRGYAGFLTLELGWNYAADAFGNARQGLLRAQAYLEQIQVG